MSRFYTKIRPSQFMSDNPSKDELLYMYEWLYNYNKKKGDKQRCEELINKYNIIKQSTKVTTYKITNGIPMLIGAVGSLFPNVNYTITNKGMSTIPNSNAGLSFDDLENMANAINAIT